MSFVQASPGTIVITFHLSETGRPTTFRQETRTVIAWSISDEFVEPVFAGSPRHVDKPFLDLLKKGDDFEVIHPRISGVLLKGNRMAQAYGLAHAQKEWDKINSKS